MVIHAYFTTIISIVLNVVLKFKFRFYKNRSVNLFSEIGSWI